MDSTTRESVTIEPSLLRKCLKITGVVALYWFVSISLVFINKHLLSSEELKLDAPVFITLAQCFIAVVCFIALGMASQNFPDLLTFPSPEYSINIAIKILPLSLVFVGMITFNNLTLKYLGVAFYNVGRSLTTVFNVLLSFIILRQTISIRIITCCTCIVLGFLLGVKEEGKNTENFDGLGVICGVLASLCVALYSILIKRSLPLVDDNIWRLQMYNNYNAVILLTPLMLIMKEVPVLKQFQFFDSPTFWGMLILSGIFGLAIGYVMSLQIKVTTPLTHNISGTAKAGFQTVLACIIFKESKSWWWWMCNFMVLGGSSAYTYVKMLEMKAGMANNNNKPHPQIKSEGKGEENK